MWGLSLHMLHKKIIFSPAAAMVTIILISSQMAFDMMAASSAIRIFSGSRGIWYRNLHLHSFTDISSVQRSD